MTTRTGSGRGVALRAAMGVLGVAGTASVSVAQSCADHGVPVNGYPTWHERATLVVTNACRIAPTAYRTTLLPSAPNILHPSVYPAVPPLQWNLPLSQAARAHSIDQATTVGCPFAHNSCDGTLWNVRIASFYPGAGSVGENAAAGFYDPLSTVNALLIDNTVTGPAPDNSSGDGHRRNIMSSGFTQVGCGYASGPNTYNRYWTQDFARPLVGAGPICSPIASGSHVFQLASVAFWMNFYDAGNAAPQSVSVVINGVSTPMPVYLGTAARGTYRATLAAGPTCRSYYFEVRDSAGTLWRYPARGEFRTFGEGACAEDYVGGAAATPCAVDFDSSGELTSADIFAYLNAWLAGGGAGADFDRSGTLDVQDIFEFLNAWFEGC